MIRLIWSKDFARLLQKRFGTGKRFTRAYIDYFESEHGLSLKSEQDRNALSETHRMWFDFALSTNMRGREMMRYLERHKRLRGGRYLDIGCGYGGFPIAAARRGATAVGIEPDPLRAGFSRENIADSGLAIAVHEVDALEPGIEQRLGTFDVITCNDVAEHVASAPRLLENIRRLLNPGGLAYFEIPNPRCVEFVARDGHFGLFGITLLDREGAISYHAEHYKPEYDVGEYWTLEEYGEFFTQAGLSVKLVDPLHHPVRPMSDLDDLLNDLESARRAHPLLDLPYESYLAALQRDRRELPENYFRNRYLCKFWTFLASPQDAIGQRQ
jgi:2-polyprenyl-3-methyl-5-hydroxy-6-metoxy-1,4-benzoquinol methylase